MMFVACLIGCTLLSVVIRFPPTNAKVNSPDVAVVKMEMAQHQTKELTKIIEENTEMVKDASEPVVPDWLLVVFKAWLKAGSAVAQFFGLPDVHGYVFDIIELIEDSEGRILEEIEKLGKSINFIDEKLDDLEKELKNSMVLTELLSDFNDVANAVENGDKKLRQILQLIMTRKGKREVRKLAEEYVNHYDWNNIDLHIDNLIKMATQQERETETQSNLFDRFIVEKGCDAKKLSIIVIQVKRLVALAARQVMAYHFFKGDGDRAAESSTAMKKSMYKIRKVFQAKVWQCMGNTHQLARDDVVKILKSTRNQPDDTVVDAVFEQLTERYPWYSWAVASIDKDQGLGQESKGETYFTAEDGDKRMLLVVYFDVESDVSCFDLSKVQTLVHFRICTDCKSAIKASEGKFLTKQRCGDITHKSLDFIGSGTQTSIDSCNVGGKCSGNGVCNSVPHSKTFLCVCREFVEGESCDVTVNPDDSEKVLELIASMRKDFDLVFKVPTTVDTHFEILSLSTKMDSMKRDLISVIKHWDVIKDAELVIGLYARMKKGDVDFDSFGHTIQKHLLTISELELKTSLYNMILAKGLLSSAGNDFYTVFKKQWFAKNPQSPCNEQYNVATAGLMRNLALLDQSLGEVLIMYREWLMKKYGKTQEQRDKFIEEADSLKTEFKSRQLEYQDYWKKHSCGDLKLSEVSDGKVCKDQLSYEGMTVKVACSHQRVPEYIIYECKKNGISLDWVTKGKCLYTWGAWGDWGSCSKSCEGGVQTRKRVCKGTANVEDCETDNNTPAQDQRPCNIEDCCAVRDKFKCPYGKCIPRSSLCNGENDCGDNTDESDSQCPNALRSGDVIALRSDDTAEWLGCWHWQCALTTCDVYGKPWSECQGEKFRFLSLSRSEGSILRHGDPVGVQYNLHHDNWLSCWNSRCGRSTCPGYSVPNSECGGELFQIFSPKQRGNCAENQVSCQGDYIRQDDEVYIHYTLTEGWVGYSSYGWIYRYASTYSWTGKKNFRWRIVTRNN